MFKKLAVRSPIRFLYQKKSKSLQFNKSNSNLLIVNFNLWSKPMQSTGPRIGSQEFPYFPFTEDLPPSTIDVRAIKEVSRILLTQNEQLRAELQESQEICQQFQQRHLEGQENQCSLKRKAEILGADKPNQPKIEKLKKRLRISEENLRDAKNTISMLRRELGISKAALMEAETSIRNNLTRLDANISEQIKIIESHQINF